MSAYDDELLFFQVRRIDLLQLNVRTRLRNESLVFKFKFNTNIPL